MPTLKNMNNTIFEYLRPTTPLEACNLIDKYGKESILLAGGTDVIPQIKDGAVVPNYCIDMSFISDFDYIRIDTKNICIGALSRVARLEESADIKKLMPILSEAASHIGSPQIRNIATIGGNICNASPCADMAVSLLALDAELKLLNSNSERWVTLDEFYLGNVIQEDVTQAGKITVLKRDELLAEIRIPIQALKTRSSFLKLRRTAVDIAIVNAAIKISVNKDGIVSDARIALGSVAPRPMRSKKAEKLLLGLNVSRIDKETLEKVSCQAAEETKPITDIRGSAEYRKIISEALVKRGIEKCLNEVEERQV